MPFDKFLQWPAKKKISYWREVREAWWKFESAASASETFAERERSTARSQALAWLAGLMGELAPFPVSNAEGENLCLIGGVERSTVANESGIDVCPTSGRGCGSLGAQGFLCGTVYNNACVSRFPIGGITSRCHAQAGDAVPGEREFDAKHAEIERVAKNCESGRFSARFKENCDGFRERLNKIQEKYGENEDYSFLDEIEDESRAKSGEPSPIAPSARQPLPVPPAPPLDPSDETPDLSSSPHKDDEFEPEPRSERPPPRIVAPKALPSREKPAAQMETDPSHPICTDLLRQSCKNRSSLDDGTNSGQTVELAARRAFPRLQELLIAKMERYVEDAKIRKKIVARIRAVELHVGGRHCRRVPAQMAGPAYYPNSNSISMCLPPGHRDTSAFLMAQVIGHELAHSIDPCHISMAHIIEYKKGNKDSEFILPSVLKCLRGSSSLHARNGSLCSPGPPFGPRPDQIGEAFADWAGNELAPDYIAQSYPHLSLRQRRNGYTNLVRKLCGSPSTANDPHPSPVYRANFGMLAQPKIRQQLGCSPEPPPGRAYCSADGNSAYRSRYENFPLTRQSSTESQR